MFQGAGNLLWCRLPNQTTSVANHRLPPLPFRLFGQALETPPCHGPSRKRTIEHWPPWDNHRHPKRADLSPFKREVICVCAVIGEIERVNFVALCWLPAVSRPPRPSPFVWLPIKSIVLARFAGTCKKAWERQVLQIRF